MTELTTPKESAIRKKIDAVLTNLGWTIDEQSPSCNVFTERAKTREQETFLAGKQPDYLLYRSNSDIPIGVIEAKPPGHSLHAAIEQAVERYATPLDISIVFATDGTFVETYDIRSGEALRLDGNLISQLMSEDMLLRFVDEGSNIFSPPHITISRQELIKVFEYANNLLRDEGLRKGTERFTEFSNLLFLKLISEIEEDREIRGESSLMESQCLWQRFCDRDPEDMLVYINDSVLPRLVDRYNHSGDVFLPSLLIRNPITLYRIVQELSKLTLLNTDSDIKGDAFEYFLKNSITVGNDLGEYFTPRHIVSLMVELVDPKFGETVYDPCCGTGGFLISAFEHIKQKVLMTKEMMETLKNKTVFGRELTSSARIAKMNMILTGDGHTNISQIDSLSSPVSEEYEVVLTNYAFSQSTDYSFHYGLSNRDANPVFLKHVIDAVKPGGRAGVVVPDSVLYGEESDHKNVRRVLLNECDVTAIIKLHTYVFRPYAGQPTSIVIFEKGTPTKSIWFFEVNEDGFKKTGSKYGRPPGEANDLPLLREAWENKEDTPNSFSVDVKVLAENQNKLIPNLYKNTPEHTLEWVPLGGPDGLCDISLGKTPPKKDPRYWGGRYLWAKISDLNSKYITDTAEKITEEAIQETGVRELPENTLLFSFKLTIGRTAIAGQNLFTNEAIAALTPKDNRVLREYLFYVLPRLDYTPYSHPTSKGDTLNLTSIPKVLIPLPSIEKQEILVANMREFDVAINDYKSLLGESQKIAEEFIHNHIERGV